MFAVNVRSGREMMKTMIDLGLNDDEAIGTVNVSEGTSTIGTEMASDDTDEGPMRIRMKMIQIAERGGGDTTTRRMKSEKRGEGGGGRGRGKIGIVGDRENRGGLILEKERRGRAATRN